MTSYIAMKIKFYCYKSIHLLLQKHTFIATNAHVCFNKCTLLLLQMRMFVTANLFLCCNQFLSELGTKLKNRIYLKFIKYAVPVRSCCIKRIKSKINLKFFLCFSKHHIVKCVFLIF